MYDEEIRRETARSRFAELHRDRHAPLGLGRPVRRTVGTLLIRAGLRLAHEPARSSALAHEALPRC